MKALRISTLAAVAVVFCMAGQLTVASAAEANDRLVARYTGMLDELRAELTAKVPEIDLEKAKTAGSPEAQQLKAFLASDKLDAKFAKYVILLDGTPEGLAAFAGQGKSQRGRKIWKPSVKLFIAMTSGVLPTGLLYATAGIEMMPSLP